MPRWLISLNAMVLKALLLDFNGIVLKDTGLKGQLIDEILISENLRPNPEEYFDMCAERSDRACLDRLLTRRGRITTPEFLNDLLTQLSTRYLQQLAEISRLPIYPGLEDLLYQAKVAALPVALVTAAAQQEVDWVLDKAQLVDRFAVKIMANDLAVTEEKPSPRGYEIAIARLNEQFPELTLTPKNCLAIEAWYPGITAAKQAGIPVVGVAHCHPYRMVQRRANWVVDYLNEIDFEWIGSAYKPPSAA
ncbi:MAG: HAD family phosphatase [Leptolyngbya sp. SIOISBB]|nr:HAD family phosphatase [Leptolyngbya sp. SIOISBB]